MQSAKMRGGHMIENGFKTKAFGGFDKKQVLEYIDGIHAEFGEKSSELNAQINELDSECSQLAISLENTYNKNLSLEAEIKDLINGKNELSSQLEQTSAELEEIKKRESEQKELLKRATFQVESMKRKCDKYDELHGEINDILAEAKQMKERTLLEAKNQADDIVKDAKAQAQRITAAAKIRAESFSGGINDVGQDIVTIKSGVAEMAKQVDDKLAELQEILNAACAKTAVDTGMSETKKENKPSETVNCESKAENGSRTDKFWENFF